MSEHLKRLNTTKTLKIHRKERKWTIRPKSGPHPLKKSIPLGLLVRDYLELADNRREARQIISSGEILVDGEAQKDYQYPCGLMDVITLPKLKKHYRILFNQKGRLTLVTIDSKDSEWKLLQIKNKTMLKKGLVQLNLHDGRNKIVKKDEYGTGDVLKISLKDRKIQDVFKFKKGSVSMITGGNHIGEVADIQDLTVVPSSRPNLVSMKGKTEFSTLTDYVFPIGEKKPTIELPEVKIQ